MNKLVGHLMFNKLFLEHPRQLGQSYLEHMTQALSVGGKLLLGGLACLLHAFIPGLFTTTASDIVREINGMMSRRKP